MGYFIEKSIKRVVTLLFIIMVVVIFAQTVSRYLFGVSIVWAEETARYCMIWLTFLGATLAVKEKAHMKIDFFVNLLPQNMQRWATLTINFLLIVCLLSLSYNSIPIVKVAMSDMSQGLEIPLGFVYIAFPLSGIIMILYLLMDTVHLVVRKEKYHD